VDVLEGRILARQVTYEGIDDWVRNEGAELHPATLEDGLLEKLNTFGTKYLSPQGKGRLLRLLTHIERDAIRLTTRTTTRTVRTAAAPPTPVPPTALRPLTAEDLSSGQRSLVNQLLAVVRSIRRLFRDTDFKEAEAAKVAEMKAATPTSSSSSSSGGSAMDTSIDGPATTSSSSSSSSSSTRPPTTRLQIRRSSSDR
jgi:hypothetical protein